MAEDFRRTAATRVTRVRIPLGRPGRSVATARGYFSKAAPRGWEESAESRRGKSRHLSSFHSVLGSQRCGRRSTARISARHAEDAGSSPAGHTNEHNQKHEQVGVVSTDQHVGAPRRRGGFDSLRPHHSSRHAGEVLMAGHSARTRDAAGSIPAAGPILARCADRGFLHCP